MKLTRFGERIRKEKRNKYTNDKRKKRKNVQNKEENRPKNEFQKVWQS